jgi:hypothetical protein
MLLLLRDSTLYVRGKVMLFFLFHNLLVQAQPSTTSGWSCASALHLGPTALARINLFK